VITSGSYNMIVPGVKIVEVTGAQNVLRETNVRIPSVIGTSNWGPDDEIVSVYSVADLLDKYGDRSGGNLVKFVETILLQGAGLVKCLRIVDDDAVKATRQVTAGAATTWDFTAKYYGTEGNNVTIQIVEGSLTGKVTVIVTRNGTSERIENVDNDGTSADYIGTKWSCSWVDFAKTGVATTNPSVDATPVAMTTGANGSTPADGDVVTKMDDWEADTTIDMVATAFTASAALRTGLLNHCTKMMNRTYYISPVDQTSKSTIIAEMAGYNDPRGEIVYPPLSYYNLETGAREDQDTAWRIGVVARNAPQQAAIGTNYGFIRNAVLSVSIAQSDWIDYVNAHVCIGVPSPAGGFYSLNQPLEYRDEYFGKLQIRTIYDKVEAALDAGLSYLIGFGGNVFETKAALYSAVKNILEYYKDLGYMNDYRIVTDSNTTTTRLNAEAYVDVYLEVFPGVEKLLCKVGKLSDYQIEIMEVAV